MWTTLPAAAPLYRVTRTEDTWDDVLLGAGAFHGDGGRYSLSGQPTVYASEDPLVALTEFGWHAGLTLSETLGGHTPTLNYPLLTSAKLWRFHLNTAVALADLTSPVAALQLGFPAHLPYNPHPHLYYSTRTIATKLRAHKNPRPEGLLAPSVRTPVSGPYSPKQVVLFVLPAPTVVSHSLAQRATLLDQWDVEMEFGTAGTHASVMVADPLIAWSAPWVRLSGSNPVPKFKTRPGSKPLSTGSWFTLDVRYTQH
ncbi:MAG: RES family NAD+ phosphorylase [Fimbriiglobus sp.]|nr:RES family NAD+ phosphorylase [Fimbriiglobus sp.]